MRVAIIGAGPTGLVAAIGARARGHEVTVLEAAEVGESLRRWGTTRFFTPFAMNLPEAVRRSLREPPSDDALLTGPEMVARVLEPLARTLGDAVKTRHRVVSVARARMTRMELPRHPLRAERAFSLLVDTPAGERVLEADRVLDASGVYGVPLWMGPGGRPARGERALSDRVLRDLGALARNTVRLVDRRVLLVGHGHSAANAILVLADLQRSHPDTRVTWAVRAPNARPVQEVADDPLPERRQVAALANDLAQRPPSWLTVERRAHVEALSLAPDGSEAIAVELSGNRVVTADELIALVGYRPDTSITSELALELGAVGEGAARLERALANVTDCLSVPRVAGDDLDSGEPGFFLVGAKSYGRARTFLLQTGYSQLATILDRL